MHPHRKGCSDHEVWVAPWGHLHQRTILGKSVEGVEHLDDDKHAQRKSRSLKLAFAEILTRVLREIEAAKVIGLEILPLVARAPIQKLVGANQGVPIFCHIV